MTIEIDDIKTLTLHPDQVLVVQCEPKPIDLIEKIMTRFQAMFPNNRIIFLDKDTKISVIDALDSGKAKRNHED